MSPRGCEAEVERRPLEGDVRGNVDKRFGDQDFKMVKASVPSFFLCPISLELMKDPVTLRTGQTYDRRSIEKWFEAGHNTCPATMQVINSSDIAPNHTLQRLIQHWCSSNNYRAVEELPVVSSTQQQQDADVKQVQRMLQRVARGTESLRNLKKLRNLAKKADGGHENRRVLREAKAIPILANFVFSPENLVKDSESCEEALGILTLLPLQKIRKLVVIGTKQLTAISWLLNRGSLDGRLNAASFLGALAGHDPEMKASVGATAGVFEGLVQLLKEDIYPRAIDTGLKTVLAIISDGPEKNTNRAVKAGVVFAAAELLPDAEKRNKVRSLTKLLELLCSTADGREALSAHALIVPVLARIISLGDDVASEAAVFCLWTLCRCFPKECVDEAARQAGMLSQLLHLVQAHSSGISPETKQRATQILQQLRRKLQTCDSRSK